MNHCLSLPSGVRKRERQPLVTDGGESLADAVSQEFQHRNSKVHPLTGALEARSHDGVRSGV